MADFLLNTWKTGIRLIPWITFALILQDLGASPLLSRYSTPGLHADCVGLAARAAFCIRFKFALSFQNPFSASPTVASVSLLGSKDGTRVEAYNEICCQIGSALLANRVAFQFVCLRLAARVCIWQPVQACSEQPVTRFCADSCVFTTCSLATLRKHLALLKHTANTLCSAQFSELLPNLLPNHGTSCPPHSNPVSTKTPPN
jgi:hypothetical protein